MGATGTPPGLGLGDGDGVEAGPEVVELSLVSAKGKYDGYTVVLTIHMGIVYSLIDETE